MSKTKPLSIFPLVLLELTLAARQSVFCLAAIIFLCSCAPVPYKKAEGPEVATITLTNASSSWIRAMESQQGDCRDMHFMGGNVESIYAGQNRTTYSNPGGVLVFNVVGNVGFGYKTIHSCAFNVGLVVEPNGEYALRYVGTDDGCRLEARQLTKTGWHPVELKKYKLHNLIGPQSCSPAEVP